MPPKKAKKPRTRRAPAKKNKGLKQKQKQRQVVNVSVSAGGSGGGGTQFIPMPQATQAPQFDYSLLASLIRPANTVDVPIRAAAPVAESVATRAAEPEAIRPSFMDAEVSAQPAGTPKVRLRFVGESDEDYMLRMKEYEQAQTVKKQREKEQRAIAKMSGLPEATAFVEADPMEAFAEPPSVGATKGRGRKKAAGDGN